ncbi:hypothetical protein CDAR_317821 [Caerostris darwini]|uniref:Uncharacterized protein n=1 Tax=Caerostris darwini TaxID=1538125 RepID=A0AAV4WUW0_9ARAC|nr:hypothetical protein CDAR_317821 [Caerostris darwini]
MHYNGRGITPDLLCVSTDLSPFTKRIVIGDPGSGHRRIIASIVIQGHETKPHYSQLACTLEELRLANEGQRVKKSPGEDNIQAHVEAFKYMSDTTKNTLLCTFNKIWETGLVIA